MKSSDGIRVHIALALLRFDLVRVKIVEKGAIMPNDEVGHAVLATDYPAKLRDAADVEQKLPVLIFWGVHADAEIDHQQYVYVWAKPAFNLTGNEVAIHDQHDELFHLLLYDHG